MQNLYPYIRPILFSIDAEKAHNLTLKAMKCGLTPKAPAINAPELEQVLWGLKFPNPVGLSAGFDKNAEVIGPAFNLGFGFVETGTVTPKPQEGNPKPRIFRDIANEAVINRMGFPNAGADVYKANLEKFLSSGVKPQGVIGLNIGMNKTQKTPVKDYAYLIRLLAPMADYLTVNISSPNTPGLRDLQRREPLLELIDAMKEERAKACRTHLLLIVMVDTGQLDGIFILPVLVILVREFLISGLREFLGPKDVQVPVTMIAKWKTTIQMLAIGFLIVGYVHIGLMIAGWALITAAAGITAYTGYIYLKASWIHLQ